MSKPKIIPIPGSDRCRVDFRKDGRNGRRYRGTFDTAKEGQEYIDKVLAGDAKPVRATLPGLIDEYIRWAEKIKGKAPNTVRCDRARLKVFERWAPTAGVHRPADLDFKKVAAFQQYFYDNHPFDKGRIFKRYKALKPQATWEKYRQILSAFCVWAIKRGHAKINPAADPELKTKSQRDIPNPFNPDELAKVLAYFDDRDANLPYPVMSIFLRLMVYTGIRRGEAISLKWSDVDLKAGVIRLVRSKNKEISGIPINPKLRLWLDRLPKNGPLVLDDGHGGPLYSPDWYLRALVTACKETGVPRRRIHDLRHTFAVTLVLKGVSLAVVQRLLGHKSIQTTMIYLTFMPDDLRAAVDVLDY